MLQEEKVTLTSSIQESIDLVYAGLSNQCNGIVFGAIKETRLSSLVKNQELQNQSFKPTGIITGKLVTSI